MTRLPLPLVTGCCYGGDPKSHPNPVADNIFAVLFIVALIIVILGNIWWWRWGRKARRNRDLPPTHEGS